MGEDWKAGRQGGRKAGREGESEGGRKGGRRKEDEARGSGRNYNHLVAGEV